MSRLLVVLVLGLLVFGFVSGGEDKVSIIVLSAEDGLAVPDDNMRRARGFSVMSDRVEISEEKINHRYSSVEGFSAEVTLEELEELKRDSSKKIFVDDAVYSVTLDVSVPNIGANDSWALVDDGVNLTGVGQTVCIIDTGVNYSHSAFGNCYGDNNASSNCTIIGGYDFVNDDSYPLDDHGHGTHVAGIVASGDSTYKGVAPDVKIIAIKALDSGGSGAGVDIVAGIDWCVNNASKFNIGVISMSLGDNSTYNSYCNGNYFASFIDNAVAAGIAVVVSAGNCNEVGQSSCTTGVAIPACVESAIIAGAVNDADSVSGANYMRGALLELFAPGVGIVSSVIGGGFGTKSGTSMAAPHVSGAIALMNQYFDLSSQTKTPSEIEDIFNDTGVFLDDSAGSGYNFSRIDVYSAILSVDVDAPSVALVSPVDDHINITINQSFVCNATDWQLANVTLKIWNSSEFYYNATNDLTGTSNESSFDLANMPLGDYSWNCFVSDNMSNLGNASANFSLTIGSIEVSLNSPANESYTNVNATDFNCSARVDSGYELANMTFRLWNSSDVLIYNLTENISGTSNITIFNYTFSVEDDYLWECIGVNNNSYEADGVNYSVTYDATAPSLNLTSLPSSATSNSISRVFQFNVSDDNLANCSLIYEDAIQSTNDSINDSVGQTFSDTFTPGTYTWSINCSDLAGNVNNSEENSFTITRVSSGGSNPSSSDDDVAEVYEVSVVEAAKGYSQELEEGEKISFSVSGGGNSKHSLTVDEVGEDYVNLVIESDPVNLTLKVGESRKLNLSSVNYYDFFVRLDNITDGVAGLTIQLISEMIVVEEEEDDVEEGLNKSEDVVDEGDKIFHTMEDAEEGFDLAWVLLGIIGLIGLIVVLYKSQAEKKRPEKKVIKKNLKFARKIEKGLIKDGKKKKKLKRSGAKKK